MAALSDTLVRAHDTRETSRRLREITTASRRAADDSRRACQAVLQDLAVELERRDRASEGLGTWPYWAPATPSLLNVLVVAPSA